MDILLNHMGFSAKSAKKAVLQCQQGEKPDRFCVLDSHNNEVASGTPQYIGPVANWSTGIYWVVEFSELAMPGDYCLAIYTGNEKQLSPAFEISEHLLTMRMLNAVSYYFKAQRSSGEWLLCDRSLPFRGGREGVVDAHGGWYDATGDYGIHLSHLSHSTYHNPQQACFSAYTFLKMGGFLHKSGNESYTMLRRRALDEGFFGADFIMRLRAPSGSFFRSINRANALDAVANSRAIGFEYCGSSAQFSKTASTADSETVTDENYEVSMRSGGGISIAALALAGRFYYPSAEYSQHEYIQSAKSAWAYLKQNNERYTNDGVWNLVDEYCALVAATELYITTEEYEYLCDARHYAKCIAARTVEQKPGMCRLEVVPGLPYYHASDEGLPIISLLHYAEIEPNPTRAGNAQTLCERILRWKLTVTDSQSNPFGYPILESLENGKIVPRFFFPHTSTAAPWWQGDNARIASIAAACALMAATTKDVPLAARCRRMAQDPLDWIMGLNPFDSCMIEGYGRNNIQYFYSNKYDFLNCPGGIVNGITSATDDEDGIEFIMRPTDRVNDNWRWAEQWIPHANWYLYAMALKFE